MNTDLTPRIAATILAVYARLDSSKRQATRTKYAPALVDVPTIQAEGMFVRMLQTVAAQEA